MTKTNIKRLRSKSHTITPLETGTINEVKTSSRSPLLDRPLPPSRQVKSLPNTPLNQSFFLPSPPISEVEEDYSNDYYSSDSEADEIYYTTIIKSYEKERVKIVKDISNLHKKIVGLEENLTALQTESEDKDRKLTQIATKNQGLIKNNNLLQKENEAVHLELKLTNSDFLTKTDEVKHLTARLNKEIESSKYLVAELERQREESAEIIATQRKLSNQIARLNHDKDLQVEERERLEQDIVNKKKEFRQLWKEREEEHKKQIKKYRLFNSNPGDTTYKRQTLDLGTLARNKSVYLDHNRSGSTGSLNEVHSPTLDFQLTLQSPKRNKPSLLEELKNSFLKESEKKLGSTLTDLFTDIDDYQNEQSQTAGISPQAVKELEDRILTLTQQQETHQQQIRQQEATMQELVQKNALLQEKLTAATSQNKDKEKSFIDLHQNYLQTALGQNDLQDQLKEKDYQLQAAAKKELNYNNFVRSLAEIFPLSESQQKKLEESDEPDRKLLLLLKNNIFGGVDKLKNEVEELKQEKQNLIETQNLEDEEWIKMLTQADKEAEKWEQEQQALIEVNNHQNK